MMSGFRTKLGVRKYRATFQILKEKEFQFGYFQPNYGSVMKAGRVNSIFTHEIY